METMMKRAHNFIDLTGMRFGTRIVISAIGNLQRKKEGKITSGGAAWLCRCSICKTERVMSRAAIKHNRRCPRCLMAEAHKRSKKDKKERIAWKNMIERCRYKDGKGWHLYGGRGIQVCERWMDFNNFFADMGESPLGTSLDRIDVNGDYESGNCRWASPKEQSNNRRDNVRITFQGVSLTLSEWARKTGIHRGTLAARIKRMWPLEDAFSIEPTHRNSRLFSNSRGY